MAPFDSLNKVEATVRITSMAKDIHFVSLKLTQRFNDHHRFEIEVNSEELEAAWMTNPVATIKYIGQVVNIVMKHKTTGETNLFEGVITNMAMVGHHGKQNNIVISGCSPTIRLDGKETMDSFVDSSLDKIVKEVETNSGNGGKIDAVAPVFTGQIDYMCQYGETAFQFLNRLSYLYGEWFFYDGKKTYFGNPKDATAPAILVFENDLTDFRFSANLHPPKFNRYTYLVHTDLEPNSPAPETVTGADGYAKVSLDKSKEIYISEANLPLNPLVVSKEELDSMVAVEKTRAVADMLVFNGSSQTCKVKIGKTVKITLPNTLLAVPVKEVGTFLITEVEHTFHQDGSYSNNFTGIPHELVNIPMHDVHFPKADPQVATVLDNADNKGRVKVQFQWQKLPAVTKSTNWIRVQTPDAGQGAHMPANRGFVFIPEKNDRVMVGFEYGDPNRPFVMGSIFSENLSKGGEADNHFKTIKTRSGHILQFDDADATLSITVKDREGNVLLLNTKNKTIEITAPESITLTSKNISLKASETINLESGDKYNLVAKTGNERFSADLTTTVTNILKEVSKEHQMENEKSETKSSASVKVKSPDIDYGV